MLSKATFSVIVALISILSICSKNAYATPISTDIHYTVTTVPGGLITPSPPAVDIGSIPSGASFAGDLTITNTADPFHGAAPTFGGIDLGIATGFVTEKASLGNGSTTFPVLSLPIANSRFSFSVGTPCISTTITDCTISFAGVASTIPPTPANPNPTIPITVGYNAFFASVPQTITANITINPSCPDFRSSVRAASLPPTSNSGENTQMAAVFTVPGGRTLGETAAACGFSGFDWQQKILVMPPEIASKFAPANGGPLPSVPISDPVQGGWSYQDPTPNTSYPYYYDPNNNQLNGAYNLSENTSPNQTQLTFFDAAQVTCATAALGFSCFNNDFLEFQTELVGILPDGTPGPDLFDWTWIDNYSIAAENLPPGSPLRQIILGSNGGASRLNTNLPVDPGGVGGITILDINGAPVSSSVPEASSALLLMPGLLLILLWPAVRTRRTLGVKGLWGAKTLSH